MSQTLNGGKGVLYFTNTSASLRKCFRHTKGVEGQAIALIFLHSCFRNRTGWWEGQCVPKGHFHFAIILSEIAEPSYFPGNSTLDSVNSCFNVEMCSLNWLVTWEVAWYVSMFLLVYKNSFLINIRPSEASEASFSFTRFTCFPQRIHPSPYWQTTTQHTHTHPVQP